MLENARETDYYCDLFLKFSELERDSLLFVYSKQSIPSSLRENLDALLESNIELVSEGFYGQNNVMDDALRWEITIQSEILTVLAALRIDYASRVSQILSGKIEKPSNVADTIHRSKLAIIISFGVIYGYSAEMDDYDRTIDSTEQTNLIYAAVSALREDFRQSLEREKRRERGRDANIPLWPGKHHTDLTAGQWVKHHYGDAIADGYLSEDLKRDDPRLRAALYNELTRVPDGQPKGAMNDVIPSIDDVMKTRRENMAVLLGTSVDEAARFFGSARFSSGALRGRSGSRDRG